MKNPDVERLIDEVVQITGESKTEAVRKALEERRERLILRAGPHQDEIRLLTYLQDEVWSRIPPELLGVPLTKAEKEEILGFGEHGV